MKTQNIQILKESIEPSTIATYNDFTGYSNSLAKRDLIRRLSPSYYLDYLNKRLFRQ